MASFKEAFAKARKEGKRTFTWQGNKYTTKLDQGNGVTSQGAKPSPQPTSLGGFGSSKSGSNSSSDKPDRSKGRMGRTAMGDNRSSPTSSPGASGGGRRSRRSSTSSGDSSSSSGSSNTRGRGTAATSSSPTSSPSASGGSRRSRRGAGSSSSSFNTTTPNLGGRTSGNAARSGKSSSKSSDTKSSTRGGDYKVFDKGSDKAKDFRSAFAKARREGKSTFTWDGRKYSTKTA